jgi:lipopolysaccharide transport system permease protein
MNEIIIRAKNKWWELDVKELWQFRDLFYFLSWRDVKVKYKQTAVGVLWAIFRPFFTMVVFSVFFGRLAHISSEGAPYPIFVFSGLLFWTLFSSSLGDISDSFVGNERIITKVYFPRIILPVSSIFTNLVDFAVATVIFAGLAVYYRFVPSPWIIFWFPVLIVLTMLSTMGIGLLFGSLNVKYRDVRFVLPFFMQLLIFITPVIYPVSIVSEKWRWILGLNPMSGVIDAARAVMLGTHPIDWMLLGISCVSMVVYLILGYFYFQKVERYFADVI